MPYLLRAGSATDTRLTLASAITYPTATTTSAKIELDFAFGSTAAFATYLRSETGTSTDQGTLRIEKNTSNQLSIAITLSSKARVITTITAVSVDTRYLLSIEWDSTSQNILIKLDGATQATLTGYTQFNVANFIQILSNANSSPCGIYGLRFYRNGSLVNDYDPSGISSGTVLPDAASGNTATQAGTWPAGDGEWIFYSSGGYTLTADGATFSYSGGVASTLYSRILSADGGSFGYSGGVASTLYGRILSADGATFGYSGGASSLLYGRILNASGGSFSYSGGVATFVYNPITGYVLSADGGIFSYAGGEAALSFNQNYPTANPNDYTVNAYISTDSTYTARLSGSTEFNAIISASSTFTARLN